jgi:NhaP-type Na+/H+ or K+/H+ antiporter
MSIVVCVAYVIGWLVGFLVGYLAGWLVKECVAVSTKNTYTDRVCNTCRRDKKCIQSFGGET